MKRLEMATQFSRSHALASYAQSLYLLPTSPLLPCAAVLCGMLEFAIREQHFGMFFKLQLVGLMYVGLNPVKITRRLPRSCGVHEETRRP